MSLWSSTTVGADGACARQGIRLRRGVPGEEWEGFVVGNFVHEDVHAQGTGAVGPNPSGLSVLQQRDANFLLRQFARMGLLAAVPPDALWEVRNITLLGHDGTPYGWATAPPEATRGEHWDPASFCDETWWADQPDVEFIAPDGVLTVWDWKTAMGRPSDSSVDHHIQTITYPAGAADRHGLGDDEIVRFGRWNLRHGDGQLVERPAGWFRLRAHDLWKACFRRDQADPEDLDRSYTAGEHCGQCRYETKCSPLAISSIPDEALYRRAARLKAMGAKADQESRARLKARTSALRLADGTVIGPVEVGSHQFSRTKANKPLVQNALQEAARRAIERGDFGDLFTWKKPQKGGLLAWLAEARRRDPPPATKSTDGGDSDPFTGLVQRHKRTVFVSETNPFPEDF